jgi:SAM-dependent methyltransferase
MNTLGFYRAFEERFYAPRSVIKNLRRQYLPFVQPLATLYPGCATFDIGCGRGEWLELMQELGMSPFGLDLDAGMLQGCHELNLPAQQGDAVAHLQTLADNSQAVVSAFHVVEHISFEQLRTVVSESLRVLQPGGLLIMETPNPENIVVATRNFYLDPTHLRPIPSLLLSFLSEYHGFARVHTMRLQESHELRQRSDITLMDVLGGVSPDYAVVAQKAASPDAMAHFAAPFTTHYGIDLNELAERYDSTLQRRMGALDQRLANTEAQAGGMVDALSRIATLQDRLLEASTQLVRTQAAFEKLQTDADWATECLKKAQHQAQALEALAQEQAQRAAAATAAAEADHHEQQTRIAELTANSHYWWQQADTLETERNALRQSASWRITAPLRWAGSLVLHPATTARTSANWVIHRSIHTFQRPLSHLMAVVLRRPQLSYRINQVLVRYPALYQQLLSVAHRAGVVASALPMHSARTPQASGPAAPELASLPPRARQIYADLQLAIKNNKGID